MELLRIPIFKMKGVLMTPYRSVFVKAVAELGDFTIEKEFKAIRNVL